MSAFRQVLLSAFAAVGFSTAVQAANFSLDTGAWALDANWDSGVYPGSMAADPLADPNANAANFNRSGDGAVLSSALDQALISLRLDGQTAGETTRLTIEDGAQALVNNPTTNALMVINEAGGGDGDATVLQTGGELTVDQLRMARDGGVATLHLAGGTFTHTGSGGGRQIAMRADSAELATAIIEVAGGALNSTASGGQLVMLTDDSQLRISGGSFDLAGTANMGAAGSATLEVIGSAATSVSLRNVQNTATAVFSFLPDGGGVTPVTITNQLTLDVGATLKVDLSGYQGNGDLVLFDYTGGTLDGAGFSQVEITGGVGSVELAGGNGTQVVLSGITLEAGVEFAITAVSYDAATGRASFVFNSLPGVIYEVYSSVDLRSWEEIDDNIPGAMGAVETPFTDTVNPAFASRLYYRVQRNN